MDFSLAGVDLDSLILVERNKLWNDKKKLRNSGVLYPSVVNQLDSNCNQISYDEDRDFLEGHQRKENHKPSSPLAPGSEPRMRTMVRHGEYSPLNPNFLSPGKFILGLGEYEERRRLLMIQKKHEYKEHLSQVRLLVNSRNGNPTSTQLCHSETKQKSRGPYNEDKYMEVSNNSKSIQSSENLAYTRGQRNVPDTERDNITTQYKEIQTPIKEPFLQESIQNDAESQVDSKLSTVDVSRTPYEIGMSHSTPVENLSPRERKLADLQVSEQLSKMFFETSQETNPAQMSATEYVQARRQSHSEIYKEALRQQIEDKRKLDFELREKEKREEEAINRRVEEQQEKIRLEYLKEETKKLEMQKQRLSDFKEHPDQQQRSVRDIEASQEVEISRQISNLEEYYPNNLHKQLVLLPETSAAHSISNVKTIQHEPQLNDGLRQSINTNHIKNRIGHEVSNSVKLPPTLPFKSKSFTVIDSTVSNNSAFLKSSVDDGNRLWKPTDRSAEVKSCKTCNLEDSLPIPLFRSTSPVNLPVEISATDANRQSKAANNRVPESSQAMKKLEAKWQIPAVEKNNISRTTHQIPGGSRQKNVLTQLGAFRRQLQLEQMQTSEGLKNIRPHRISK